MHHVCYFRQISGMCFGLCVHREGKPTHQSLLRTASDVPPHGIYLAVAVAVAVVANTL